MISPDSLILPILQLQTQQDDDVINKVTHIIFNTDLLYTFAHFIVKTKNK